MGTGTDPDQRSEAGEKDQTSVGIHAGGDYVAGSKVVTQNAGGDIVGRDKITNVTNIYQAASWSDVKHQRNRQAMIQNVRDIWVKGVLENSLFGNMFIQLGVEYRPEAVEKPWGLNQRGPDQTGQVVASNARKIDLFDQASGALLILGAPGAGKTTTLLELARDLLDRADQDSTAPVPVVFSLSSWAVKHPPLADWLTEELFQHYDVPRPIARAWAQDELIIPLLDGLDEVQAEHREGCAQAINAFRAEHGLAPLVVCSRIADYEALSTHLRLRAAVLVRPLTPDQVDVHLAEFGARLAVLRKAIQEQPDFRDLAANPLMLGVMMVVYQDGAGEIALEGSADDHRTQLFRQYVERMLDRVADIRVYSLGQASGTSKPRLLRYTRAQTLHWLSWLATTMKRHGQAILYLEAMQPDWLPSLAQATAVSLGTSAVLGLALGLIVDVWDGWRMYLSLLGVVGGLAGGLIGLLVGELRRRGPVGDTFEMVAANTKVWRAARAAVAAMLVAGLSAAWAVWLDHNFHNDDTGNPIMFLALMLIVGFVAYSVGIVTVERLQLSKQGIRSGLTGAVEGGLVFGVIGGAFGSPAGFFVGATSFWPQGFMYSYVAGLIIGLVTGVSICLMFAVFGFVIGGLFGWVRGSIGAAQLSDHQTANGGMRRSARSALAGLLVVGLSSGLVGSSIGGLLGFVIGGSTETLPGVFAYLLLFGWCGGLIGWTHYGGKAIIQHVLLRLSLWRNGSTPRPWQYIGFLDYAANRVLLRRVGGGYSFIHPLLMDYFAQLDA